MRPDCASRHLQEYRALKERSSGTDFEMATWGNSRHLQIADDPADHRVSTPIYSTSKGNMYHGDTLNWLDSPAIQDRYAKKVQLVFTSPPFPLNDKKSYGNLAGDAYIEWVKGFAPKLRDLLTDDGSIAIEIGNAWEPGSPTMSTVVLEALLAFKKEADLHLCQEFVWYNPARLPSPVQWVNIERIRVKDAYTRIWWLSPTPRPKANNRNVLKPYSKSMKKLIAKKSYNSGRRPSEHVIGEKSFLTDNGGSIPPNVIGADNAPTITNMLKGSNTRSNDQYQTYCRENQHTLHPARMPNELVSFFVRFLTEQDDLIFDPFGGSNTTGAIAESEGRKWAACEADWNFATTSITRFDPDIVTRTGPGVKIYKRKGWIDQASSIA